MNNAVQTLAPPRSSGLKVIYEMQERGQRVSTSAVRERLGTSPATFTMLFKAFAQAGWVEHCRIMVFA
jgi:DtxR family transcriptional regulator, Mn-dependent transcriptional regulator